MIKGLPKKYQKIWQLCLPLLKQGRPDDDQHAQEVAELVLHYQGKIKIDKDVLIPVAMMHDIGHMAILPEHFEYITGFKKVVNGKLVHMLAGAKIAKDILTKAKYDQAKTKEIVEIISMHDADQLKDVDLKKVYNTVNKKFFHDIDSLDRYNNRRYQSFLKLYKMADRHQRIMETLEKFLDLYFYEEIKQIAIEQLAELKHKYKKYLK